MIKRNGNVDVDIDVRNMLSIVEITAIMIIFVVMYITTVFNCSSALKKKYDKLENAREEEYQRLEEEYNKLEEEYRIEIERYNRLTITEQKLLLKYNRLKDNEYKENNIDKSKGYSYSYGNNYSNNYDFSTESGVLNAFNGVNYNENGNRETYYNLNMNGVVNNAQANGIQGEYWVRDDGVKMYGDYVIVAADYNTHPYGSTVETSLGTGIVLDTGSFANENPNQLDVATDWR